MGTRGEQRRARILDAAAELLEHYGPQKTTVADIARHAGVAVGSVYLEFSSKDALVGALSTHRYRTVLGAMRTAADACPDPVEGIFAAMRARTHALLAESECGAHGTDLMHCGTCSGVANALAWFEGAQRELLVELLEAANGRGALETLEPSAAVDAILTAHVAFSPPALFERPCGSHAAALDALHALLRDGLHGVR